MYRLLLLERLNISLCAFVVVEKPLNIISFSIFKILKNFIPVFEKSETFEKSRCIYREF